VIQNSLSFICHSGLDPQSLLSKIGFSTQRHKGRRETDFLFGGEPLDKPFDKLKAVNGIERLKALSKAEGRPPNKKASVTLG